MLLRSGSASSSKASTKLGPQDVQDQDVDAIKAGVAFRILEALGFFEQETVTAWACRSDMVFDAVDLLAASLSRRRR